MRKEQYITKSALLKPEEQDTYAMLKFAPASEAELKALGEIPDGYIAGWASTPDLDSYRHVVKAGAFSKAIKERGLAGPKAIKLLLGHRWDKVAGVIKVLEYRGESLWIEAQMNLNVSYVKDAYEVCKMGGGWNFSVGFMLGDYSFKQDANKDEYLFIETGDLFEVSIVPFPGNEEATMEYVKGRVEKREPTTVAEFEKALVACGLAKSRSDAHKIILEVKKSLHLFSPTDDDTPPVEDQTKALMLDAVKLTELSALVAKMKETLTAA